MAEPAGPVVGVAEFEIWIGASASLKDRRRVVCSLMERLRARLKCSVTELDQPQAWQRARVAVACVAASAAQARQALEAVRRLVEQHPEAEIVAFEESFYP